MVSTLRLTGLDSASLTAGVSHKEVCAHVLCELARVHPTMLLCELADPHASLLIQTSHRDCAARKWWTMVQRQLRKEGREREEEKRRE